MPERYDEMRDARGAVRPHYAAFDAWLHGTPQAELVHKRQEAEISFTRVGITFSVYGEEAGTERLIPFDMVPRIVPAAEWRMLEQGLRQRVHALNLFLGDVYGEVVNIAARLTSVARPGKICLDATLAGALKPVAAEHGWRVRRLRRTAVKGYRRLEPWSLKQKVVESAEAEQPDDLVDGAGGVEVVDQVD